MVTLTHPSHCCHVLGSCLGPASDMLCDLGQDNSPLWAPAFPSAQGVLGEGPCGPETTGKLSDSWMKGLSREAPGLEGQ